MGRARRGWSAARRAGAVLGVVGALALGTACAGGGDRVAEVEAHGLGVLPYSSLEDWVSYADAVVVVEIDGEDEVPPSREEVEAGEGMIARTVTAQVTDTLWTRPDAPTPPKTVVFGTAGWAFTGERRSRMVFDGGAWPEVGRRYVIPLAFFRSLPGVEWAPIDTAAVYAFEGTKLQSSDAHDQTPAVKALLGRSPEQIRAVLRDAKADPRAVALAHLDPVERFRAVQDTKPGAGSTETPGTGATSSVPETTVAPVTTSGPEPDTTPVPETIPVPGSEPEPETGA